MNRKEYNSATTQNYYVPTARLPFTGDMDGSVESRNTDEPTHKAASVWNILASLRSVWSGILERRVLLVTVSHSTKKANALFMKIPGSSLQTHKQCMLSV